MGHGSMRGMFLIIVALAIAGLGLRPPASAAPRSEAGTEALPVAAEGGRGEAHASAPDAPAADPAAPRAGSAESSAARLDAALSPAAPRVPLGAGPGGAMPALVASGRGDGEQGAQVMVETGVNPSCAQVAAGDLPTLDCTLRAGESFAESVKAAALGVGGPAGTVRLEGVGLLPGMTLRKLDPNGQETDDPLTGSGDISARLRFRPSVDQATRPDQPIEIEIAGSLEDGQGAAGARAAVRLRFHVLGATRTLMGYKFEDRDGDGQRDGDEAGIPGWDIHLRAPNGQTQTTATDMHGRFSFEVSDPQPGAYRVSEEAREGWLPTRPDAVELSLTDDPAGAAPIEVLFGNRREATPVDMKLSVRADRGCRETGDASAYALGAPLFAYFMVGGVPEAEVSLMRVWPGGASETLFERRTIPGGQPFSIQTTAGDQAGSASLILSAYLPGGAAVHTDTCSYDLEPVAAPAVAYEPQRMDFGQVPAGQSASATLTVRNVGTVPVDVNSVSIQSGGGSAFTIEDPNLNGLSIQPGQSYAIPLRFAPRFSGNFQDYVVLRCNASNMPVMTVPLYGQTVDLPPPVTGQIQADRGCLEDGANPLYFVGDPIRVQLRVDGPSGGQALARVEDVSPGGQSRVVFDRQVPLNQAVGLNATISPPTGDELLRLTAQAGGYTARDECSFRVAAGGTRISGYKFNDQNGNGIWDGNPQVPGSNGSEPPIPGWLVTLTGPQSAATATDASGYFEFVVSAPGTYYLTEEQQDGWRPTREATVSVVVRCFPGEYVCPTLFGNKQTDTCPGCQPCPHPGPGCPDPHPSPTPVCQPNPCGGPTSPPPPPPGPTQPPLPTSPPGPTSPPPPGPTGPPPPPPPVACQVQISPRPNLMNVAELAQLTATVTGATNPSYQWSVSGEILRDYSESTRQQWSVVQMQPAHFQARTIAFYWKPEANQRHPQNAGPQTRTVTVTATTAQGSCSDTLTLNVERNTTSLNRQAEDFYTSNHNQAILVEHTLWHGQYPFQGFSYDGTLFFDFHRQYMDRFNSWRAEFGYPPLLSWDSGTSIPRGVDIDHAARAGSYTPLPKPSWFTLTGSNARPGNGLPCDTQSGQRRLRDYPADRRLLGCATTHPWHNAVHTGVGGDMLNPQWSPRDPLFWRWHGFVDVISQERQSVFFFNTAPEQWSDPSFRPLAPGQGPAQQQDELGLPHVIYQVPFRLYRFMDRLERYTVVFDRAVAGVSADDLTVNGQPARSVTGSREGPYVFEGFEAPQLGPVTVRLAPGGISSVENGRFEGAEWPYILVDPEPDDDRDGLSNGDEVNIHLTHPQDRDSDDDGLPDGDEVKLYGTRPLMWDSDRDSANDRCELEKGSDPNDPASLSPGCPVSAVFVCWAGNGEPIDR